jgi:hypothetical protein
VVTGAAECDRRRACEGRWFVRRHLGLPAQVAGSPLRSARCRDERVMPLPGHRTKRSEAGRTRAQRPGAGLGSLARSSQRKVSASSGGSRKPSPVLRRSSPPRAGSCARARSRRPPRNSRGRRCVTSCSTLFSAASGEERPTCEAAADVDAECACRCRTGAGASACGWASARRAGSLAEYVTDESAHAPKARRHGLTVLMRFHLR